MFATRAFILVVAVALLFANQAYAAGTVEARAALTATNSGKSPPPIPACVCTTLHERILNMPLFLVAACNPPNNGNHHVGSSCKFFTGPSDKSPVHHGRMFILSNIMLPDKLTFLLSSRLSRGQRSPHLRLISEYRGPQEVLRHTM